MASKTVETRKIKYGRLWPNKPWGKNGALIQCPDWYIELVCLREYHHQRSLKHTRLVSWAQHFVNFTTEVFGDPAYSVDEKFYATNMEKLFLNEK